MKKTLFLALLLGFALTSCGEINKNSGENVDNPFLDDEPTEELQPDEQKTSARSSALKITISTHSMSGMMLNSVRLSKKKILKQLTMERSIQATISKYFFFSLITRASLLSEIKG